MVSSHCATSPLAAVPLVAACVLYAESCALDMKRRGCAPLGTGGSADAALAVRMTPNPLATRIVFIAASPFTFARLMLRVSANQKSESTDKPAPCSRALARRGGTRQARRDRCAVEVHRSIA